MFRNVYTAVLVTRDACTERAVAVPLSACDQWVHVRSFEQQRTQASGQLRNCQASSHLSVIKYVDHDASVTVPYKALSSNTVLEKKSNDFCLFS